MSPILSLRSALAYAGNLFSQLPFAAADAPTQHPFAIPDVTRPDLGQHPAASDTVAAPYMSLHGSSSSGASCPRDGPMSCHNSTPVASDSCCFVYPSGRLLLTQFWDSHVHAGGSAEDWTIHGLWPDLCDGSFDAYCGMAPRFDNISAVLAHHGRDDLLDFMDRYWVADRGSNEHLWAHEYNKHATCINTLAPSCYSSSSYSSEGEGQGEEVVEGGGGGDDDSSYTAGVEVVDYFARATSLFRGLNSYKALADAGIVPSQRAHYPLVDVQAALERLSGGKVVLRCGGGRRDVLHEAWYMFFVRGSLQTGEFVPAQDLGRKGDASNCVPWVRYLPKRRR